MTTRTTETPPSLATKPKEARRSKWVAALSAADQERLTKFAAKRVKHVKMQAVIDELSSLLMVGTDSNLILITGATGVGKTTLSKELSQVCADLFREVFDEDPSALPVVWSEAYANGDNRHGFRTLYEDLLLQLMEPATARKCISEVVEGKLIVKPQGRLTIAALRNSVESGLRNRKTMVCAIDEAYHLLRFANESAVLDTLKSLSNTTNAKFVLIGSFDLFDLFVESGQVARRTTVINFDRYHLDNEQDRKEFRKVVKMLQDVWPCDDTPNLAAISDELMEACLGCVGLLKSMMLDAAAIQMGKGGKWSGAFLAKAAKANGLREVIRREIEAGEVKVRDAVMGVSLWSDAKLAEMQARMEASNG